MLHAPLDRRGLLKRATGLGISFVLPALGARCIESRGRAASFTDHGLAVWGAKSAGDLGSPSRNEDRRSDQGDSDLDSGCQDRGFFSAFGRANAPSVGRPFIGLEGRRPRSRNLSGEDRLSS